MGVREVPRMTSESLVCLYDDNFLFWNTSPNCPPQGHRVLQEEFSRDLEQTHEILSHEKLRDWIPWVSETHHLLHFSWPTPSIHIPAPDSRWWHLHCCTCTAGLGSLNLGIEADSLRIPPSKCGDATRVQRPMADRTGRRDKGRHTMQAGPRRRTHHCALPCQLALHIPRVEGVWPPVP